MNRANIDNYTNDIINQKETNFTQQSNFLNPQPFIDPQNNNINSENLIQSAPPEEKSPTNELSDENEDNNRKQLKRRSKREVEGRNYICKICSKSYLSYPALYTHYKQKHNTNNSSGRGRGRPKKLVSEHKLQKSRFVFQHQSYLFRLNYKTLYDPNLGYNIDYGIKHYKG